MPRSAVTRTAPQVEVRGFDLIQRRPFASGGACHEPQTGDGELNVEVEAGIVEEVRVEVSRPHHADGALHDLRLVDSEIEGNARADPDEAQHRGQYEDDGQGEDRLAHVACFPPLPFSHRFSQKMQNVT